MLEIDTRETNSTINNGALENRSLREVLNLPPELEDVKEIVLGAVSDLRAEDT
jgi:hypothetical protein